MSRDKILQAIRNKGPVLPVHISKEIGTNILFASAMLSELVARKELKISNLKIGGSPLYYIPGQEQMLENFIDKLNDKDKAVYSLIKGKKLLRDCEESPINRVALRSIKDFAIPLEVTHNNKKEIFWKWYSLDNQEAERYIKNILNGEQQKKQIQKEPQKQEFKKLEQPKQEIKEQIKKERIKAKLSKDSERDGFLVKLENFLKKEHLNVKDLGNRNQLSTGLIEMDTSLGIMTFYYITKNKKTITEKDIGEAVAQIQLQNLPIILFTNGFLNKKASALLDKFRNIHLKRLD